MSLKKKKSGRFCIMQSRHNGARSIRPLAFPLLAWMDIYISRQRYLGLHDISNDHSAVTIPTSGRFEIPKSPPHRLRAGIGIWFRDRFCDTGAVAEGKTNYCKTRGNRGDVGFAPGNHSMRPIGFSRFGRAR